jgi:hypothetical protein
MAFLKYRGNTTSPAKPLSTTAANAPLSNLDIDGNFASLNDTKLELTDGNLTIPGDLSAANVNSTSDLRLKKDLQQITNALDTVKELTGYTYVLISNEQKSAGLIAQDVLKVHPEVVDTSGESLKIAYGNMLGLVVEAIKELDRKVEDIKNTISNK